MKKLTRKLFISVLVAVFAFVALGTSTYAWITLSNTAEVKAFDATVEAGDAGIELSENGTTWGTYLELSNEFKGANHFSNTFDDITMKYDADGNLKFYEFETNNVDGKQTLSQAAEALTYGADAGYIEFTIKIRLSNAQASGTDPVYVAVDGAKVIFTPSGTANGYFAYTKDGETGLTETSSLLASNAARISITGNGITDDAEEKDRTVIYEQNVTTENKNTVGYSATGFAHEYALNQDYVLPTGEAAGIKYDAPKQAGSTDATQIIKLVGAQVADVKIRVWLEGWDNECHAQVLSQSFSVALGFKIV